LGRFGADNALRMKQLPHTNAMIALMRDGFHPDSAEGHVQLRSDGSPTLDYRMTGYTWDGIRRAYHSMAEIQFAAGARTVLPLHNDAAYAKNLQQARQMIDGLSLELFRVRLGSAHVMGGCAMGEDPQHAVADSLGRHHQLENLSIHDGSLFPTSIGANPQLSIYGLAAKLSSQLAERLKSA
jgi:choline dehydrogenase-like flavoprotein